MRILAHRGLPEIAGEGSIRKGANRLDEFTRAFEQGYDVEMDVRFHGLNLFCSHDPINVEQGSVPDVDRYPGFLAFLKVLAEYRDRMAFVNVKCDTLCPSIRDAALEIGVDLYRLVIFDNSVPDLVWSLSNAQQLTYAARISEYEDKIVVDGRHLNWIWVDCFRAKTHGFEDLCRRIFMVREKYPTKRLAIVSNDVHDHLLTDKSVSMQASVLGALLSDVDAVLTDRPQLFVPYAHLHK